MRAAIYDRNGPAAEVLQLTEVERPEPGPGEVRVRVHASGINPTDVKSRGGATCKSPGHEVPAPIFRLACESN